MAFYQRGRHIIMDPNSAVGLNETPLNLLTEKVLCILLKDSYVFNATTHEQFDDISASEIVATGYTARGDANPLAGKAIARDDANVRVEFDATDLVFTAIGNGVNDTIGEIAIAREQAAGQTDANTELIAHADVPNTLTNGGDVTMVWDAEGILQLT